MSIPNSTSGIHDESRLNGNDNLTGKSATPIAIVGMACRFPDNVTSPSQLWELCVSGKDGWKPIPESRFDNKSLYHKDYARAGRVTYDHYIGSFLCG
jgi:acyl transferase domain-containing protein